MCVQWKFDQPAHSCILISVLAGFQNKYLTLRQSKDQSDWLAFLSDRICQKVHCLILGLIQRMHEVVMDHSVSIYWPYLKITLVLPTPSHMHNMHIGIHVIHIYRHISHWVDAGATLVQLDHRRYNVAGISRLVNPKETLVQLIRRNNTIMIWHRNQSFSLYDIVK